MDNNLKPLVSIVFTSYNHKEYLKQAIDSLINQSYTNYELIIVDDCSTDGSQEILLQYEYLEKVNLKLQNTNSGSYVKASNFGASFAKGEYLLFAQCDDFAHPEQIEMLVKAAILSPKIGVVWSRSNMVNKEGIVFEDDFKGREKKFTDQCKNDVLISGAEMRRYLSYSCVLPNLSAALIKKELYELVGGLSEKYQVASDWAFWLSLSEVTDFYYLSKPLNNFRQHETTIRSKVKVERQIIEIFTIFNEHGEKHNLRKNQLIHLKIGFGFVWFSFIFSGVSSWFKSFFSILKKTYNDEKFNLLFLTLGIFVYLREIFYNRLKFEKK
jgi:glycosyltransferase involved in cell wall biosynthesis